MLASTCWTSLLQTTLRSQTYPHPTLTGWNANMSIMEMLDQLEMTYGKPDAMMLFANDTLFWSVFNPTDAPKSLFYRIEQCQEIAVMTLDPYLDVQVINTSA